MYQKSELFASRLFLCGTGMLAVLTAQIAAGQVSAPSTASQNESSEVGGLQEIIVTARRREENEQKIPVAVTTISGEQTRDQGISDPQSLNSKIPSLSISSSNGNRDAANYDIRGQGQAFGGSEPAVVTYFAEVPTVIAGPGTFFDLQNVQVLKGPQGTLFGRNTTGGAVLIEPTRPTNDANGYVDFSTGNYDLARTQAAVGLPLIDDTLMIRAAIDINRRRGFTEDVVTGVDYDNTHYNAYRFSILARPADGLENYTVLSAADSETHGTGQVLLAVNPAGPAVFAFPNLDTLLAEQQRRGPRATSLSTDDPSSQQKSFGATNITTWHLSDFATLKNILGYRRFVERDNPDIDGSIDPIVDYVRTPNYSSGSSAPPSQKAYSEEFQVQGKADSARLNYVIGGYAERIAPDAADDKDEIIEFGAGPIIQQSLNTDRSIAGFGQGEYDLSSWIEGLKLTAGARYTGDKRVQAASQYFITPAVCLLADSPVDCRVNSVAMFHATTWNTSLDYQITPSTLVYLAARRGYKSGGFNATAVLPSDRDFDPEYVRDAEFGVKTDFAVLGMPARVNLAAYRSIYTNIQENAVISEVPGEVETVTKNFGDGLIWGGELEATLIPVRGLTLSVFYSLIEAHYTKFNIPGPTGPEDLSQLPFPNSPKGKAGFNVRYETPEFSWGSVAVSGNYTYQSRVEFTVPLVPQFSDPQFGQNGYSLVNLRTDWNNVMGKPVDIGLFVNNLANKVYKIFEDATYPTAGFTSGSFGEPRMYGVEARYRFGK